MDLVVGIRLYLLPSTHFHPTLKPHLFLPHSFLVYSFPNSILVWLSFDSINYGSCLAHLNIVSLYFVSFKSPHAYSYGDCILVCSCTFLIIISLLLLIVDHTLILVRRSTIMFSLLHHIFIYLYPPLS